MLCSFWKAGLRTPAPRRWVKQLHNALLPRDLANPPDQYHTRRLSRYRHRSDASILYDDDINGTKCLLWFERSDQSAADSSLANPWTVPELADDESRKGQEQLGPALWSSPGFSHQGRSYGSSRSIKEHNYSPNTDIQTTRSSHWKRSDCVSRAVRWLGWEHRFVRDWHLPQVRSPITGWRLRKTGMWYHIWSGWEHARAVERVSWRLRALLAWYSAKLEHRQEDQVTSFARIGRSLLEFRRPVQPEIPERYSHHSQCSSLNERPTISDIEWRHGSTIVLGWSPRITPRAIRHNPNSNCRFHRRPTKAAILTSSGQHLWLPRRDPQDRRPSIRKHTQICGRPDDGHVLAIQHRSLTLDKTSTTARGAATQRAPSLSWPREQRNSHQCLPIYSSYGLRRPPTKLNGIHVSQYYIQTYNLNFHQNWIYFC